MRLKWRVFLKVQSHYQLAPPQPELVSQLMLSKVLQCLETKIMMLVEARIGQLNKKMDSFLEDHAMKQDP
jgi:hypothetical protein